jgi:hypothetical protein
MRCIVCCKRCRMWATVPGGAQTVPRHLTYHPGLRQVGWTSLVPGIPVSTHEYPRVPVVGSVRRCVCARARRCARADGCVCACDRTLKPTAAAQIVHAPVEEMLKLRLARTGTLRCVKWAHPSHICAGEDWGSPLPHPRRHCAQRCVFVVVRLRACVRACACAWACSNESLLPGTEMGIPIGATGASDVEASKQTNKPAIPIPRYSHGGVVSHGGMVCCRCSSVCRRSRRGSASASPAATCACAIAARTPHLNPRPVARTPH